MSNFKIMLLSSAIACLLPGIAAAQGVSAPPEVQVPGEILVTARRASESLRDVPLSVSAFSQKSLDDRGIKQIDDIARITPGVTFSRNGFGSGSNSSIAIRGISSDVGAATTGIYLNDTPIQIRKIGFAAANAYPQLFDLERVEILRGPQGTLFGAGAQGGTVRFIAPEPSLTRTSVYARGEVLQVQNGGAGFESGVAVGAPIVEDQLGFRASAFYRREPGWVDFAPLASGTTVESNANWQSSLALRGALAWAPAAGVKITPSIFYQRQRINDTPSYWEAYSDPEKGIFRNRNRNQNGGRDEFVMPVLDAKIDLGGVDLISSTSYFSRNSSDVIDYTGFVNALLGGSAIPPPQIPNYSAKTNLTTRQRNFTQEVRLQSAQGGPLKWVVGAFYNRSQQTFTQNSVDPFMAELVALRFGGAPVSAIFGSDLLPGNVVLTYVNRGIDTQLAAFGQLDYEIAPRLTVTAGARISRTRFEYRTVQDGPAAGGFIDASGVQKETPLTPKIGLSYKTTDDTLLYASASKGFRIGGVNPPIRSLQCQADFQKLGIASSPLTYGSDEVWNYEIGAKGTAFDRAVSFELSAFYIKWKNIQTQINLPNCGLNYVTNVGGASSKGLDAIISARLAPGLTVTAAAAYIDAQYDDTVSVGTTRLIAKGDKLPGSPFTVSISGRWEQPVGASDEKGYVQLNYDFRDRLEDPVPNRNPGNYSYDPINVSPGRRNDLSVRVGAELGGLDVSLFVSNLLNEHAILDRQHYTITDPVTFAVSTRPRTFGFTAAYRY